MRILHILPSLNPVTGGPAKSIPLQLTNLAALGHEVHLYTTYWPDFERIRSVETAEMNGFRAHFFPTTRLPGLGHVPYSRALVSHLRANAHEFDVFHVSSIWNPLASHSMALLRRMRLPYALTCHGMMDPVVFGTHRFAKRLWAALWDRSNVEGAQLIHFTSVPEQSKAIQRGWRIQRSIVMPINIAVASTHDLPCRSIARRYFPTVQAKHVVLFLGRINWVKNLDLLLDAVSLLYRDGRDIALLCVGPDSDGHRTALERRAEVLGIEERIVFAGLLEGEGLQAAFALANVAALVSKKENFGMAAAEALSAGLPVVLSDGVDMGKDWPAPPAWRTTQDAPSIARALGCALDHVEHHGLPLQTSRALAQAEWGPPSIHILASALQSIVDTRNGSVNAVPSGVR